MSSIAEVFSYREMIRTLVAKELRSRYKGSVLGFLWTFVNPLLMIIVYTVAFSLIVRFNIPHYSLFLFVALLPWNYFSQSLIQAAGSLVQNGGLLKKVYFPRAVLPISVVLTNLTNYLLTLLVLIPVLLLFRVTLGPSLLAFPIILIVQTVFNVSLVFLVSVANVYFRDLEHILSVLLSALIYIAPVFYDATVIPKNMAFLFRLNPMTTIIESYRDVFFYAQWPNWVDLGILFLFTAVLCWISCVLFNRLQRDIAEFI